MCAQQLMGINFKKKKSRFREKGRNYRFSDDLIAKDALIGLIFGILAALLIIIAVIVSAARGGDSGMAGFALIGSGVVCIVTGLIFSILSFRDPSGGMNSKINILVLNALDLAAAIVLAVI